MIQVLRSSSAVERLRIAGEFISGFPRSTEILVVGATRNGIDDFVRVIARSHTATFGLQRFSLLQLAVRLAMLRLAESNRTPASGLGAEAVAARAAFESLNAGRLNYFGPVADLPGFVHASTKTLSEIRLAGVPAGQLEALGASGHDNAELLTNCEQQLVEASLADRAGIFSVATDAVLAHEGRFVGLPLLLLDAVIEWRCESDFVRALLGTAPDWLRFPRAIRAPGRTYLNCPRGLSSLRCSPFQIRAVSGD